MINDVRWLSQITARHSAVVLIFNKTIQVKELSWLGQRFRVCTWSYQWFGDLLRSEECSKQEGRKALFKVKFPVFGLWIQSEHSVLISHLSFSFLSITDQYHISSLKLNIYINDILVSQ